MALWQCGVCSHCIAEELEPIETYASVSVPVSVPATFRKDDAKDEPSRDMLHGMQGNWYMKEDTCLLAGIISGSFLTVTAGRFGLPDARVFRLPATTTDTLFLDHDGRVLVGHVSFEAQHTITWNNGEVWLQK